MALKPPEAHYSRSLKPAREKRTLLDLFLPSLREIRSDLWRALKCRGPFQTAGVVLMRVPTKLSRSSWVVFLLARSFAAQLSTLVVLSSGKAIVLPTVSQRKQRWMGVLFLSDVYYSKVEH